MPVGGAIMGVACEEPTGGGGGGGGGVKHSVYFLNSRRG